MMFETMSACSEGLITVLKENSSIQDPVDIKDVVSRFTTDVIGSCAFGIECNTLKNPKSEFREYGSRTFDPRGFDKIKSQLVFVLPRELLKALHVKQINSEVENFFMDVLRSTVSYREQNNIHRNDFMHLLLQLKNKGKLTDDDTSNITPDESVMNSEQKLTFNELAAQCFGFFIAGFDTSATTMTFAMLELALNQNIQNKLREEILTVLKKYSGKISYDAIMEMKYLNMVVYGKLTILFSYF